MSSDDLDTDGIELTSSISPNGGSIQDYSGNDAVLGFIPPVTHNVFADGIPPTIVSFHWDHGNYANGDSIEITLNISER